MKVLVAGHRGMVGSSILREMPDRHNILTVQRNDLDLTNYSAVLDYLNRAQPDAVILAAAKVGGIGANTLKQRQFLVENLNIQNAVISAAADSGVENFIFLGSSCIYPKLAPQPISEESILSGKLEPTNEGYALAKISGVRLTQAIHDEEGFNYFSLMPTNLYGPNDNFDRFSSHVPAALLRKFHEAKMEGLEEVTVWGTGKPRREFMHVDDLARACWFLLEKEVGGSLINVGTGKDIEIAEFADLVSRVVGFKGVINFDTTKPDGTPQKLLDVSKIHSLGWSHQVELENGLEQTYSWFKDALSKGAVRGY